MRFVLDDDDFRHRMRWSGSLDAAWLRRWTIRLGIAAWVVLALPALTSLAFITIVGIPLGLALMATPTLFCMVALANVVQRLLGRDGPLAVGAGIALLLLAWVARSMFDRDLERARSNPRCVP